MLSAVSKPITVANLVDPAKRMWVPTYEGRDIHSYQVAPYDVAAINDPARTIRQLKNYALKKDWVNFKVGDVHEDSESAFDPQAVFKYRSDDLLVWTLGVIMRTGCFHRDRRRGYQLDRGRHQGQPETAGCAH